MKTKTCPFCGDDRQPDTNEVNGTKGFYSATCHCCGAQGPMATTRGAALVLWDERHQKERQSDFIAVYDRVCP